MAGAEERPRGPNAYAVKDAQAQRKAPPRQTSCLFKLVGLLLVLLAGYLGYFTLGYWRRTGQLPDFTDAGTQKQVLVQGELDLEVTKKASQEVLAKLEFTLADLQKRIKGKPPETKEEISALVKESKESTPRDGAEKSGTGSGAEPSSGADSAKTPAPNAGTASEGTLAQAQAEYRKGEEAYIHTDPFQASQEQVQKYIRIAAPHFEQALKLLDEARQRGTQGPAIDRLEEKAAKRLIDCRRRMEMHVR